MKVLRKKPGFLDGKARRDYGMDMQSTAAMPAGIPFFNQQNAAEYARRSHTQSNRVTRKKPIAQAIELQSALHKVGLAIAKDAPNIEDKELRARVGASLATIAKGWDTMTARILILRGKASPGTLSPAERRAAKEQRNPTIQAHPRPAPKPAPPCPE